MGDASPCLLVKPTQPPAFGSHNSSLPCSTHGHMPHTPVTPVIESQNIPSWKGPIWIIESNSWLHIGASNKTNFFTSHYSPEPFRAGCGRPLGSVVALSVLFQVEPPNPDIYSRLPQSIPFLHVFIHRNQ